MEPQLQNLSTLNKPNKQILQMQSFLRLLSKSFSLWTTFKVATTLNKTDRLKMNDLDPTNPFFFGALAGLSKVPALPTSSAAGSSAVGAPRPSPDSKAPSEDLYDSFGNQELFAASVMRPVEGAAVLVGRWISNLVRASR